MQNDIDLTDLISQTQAADLRNTSPAAISYLVKRNRLKQIEVGGKKFLSRKDVLSFESRQGKKLEAAVK